MKASKRFASLYERAEEAELRLVVVLVPSSVSSGDTIDYSEYGTVQAGPDLDAALNKIEAFLDLPSVQAITEALAERKVYVGQLDALGRQVEEVLANLHATDVSIASFEEDAMTEAAKITGTST